MFKIYGHQTRSGKVELCRTCRHAHIHKGAANGQEMMVCQAIFENPFRVTYPIVECNEYRDATLPSLSDMNKVAWFINSDKVTGRVGFTRPDKTSQEDKDAVIDNNPLD